MLVRIWMPLLLAAALALGALACSDSDDGASEAARTAEPAVGTGTPVADVSIGATTVAPGGSVTVDLIVTPQEGVTVGALDVEVVYDTSVLSATACTPGGCNATFAEDTIKFSMVTLSGFSGPAGTITFSAIGAQGFVSPLRLALESCANVEAEIIACSATDGSVAIGPP